MTSSLQQNVQITRGEWGTRSQSAQRGVRRGAPVAAVALCARGDKHPAAGGGGPVLPGLVLDGRQIGAVGHFPQSLPSTTVPFEQNQSPVPLATAIRSWGTWRGPASPRSWRTASTSRNSPRWPGCSAERPPPSVLTGS